MAYFSNNILCMFGIQIQSHRLDFYFDARGAIPNQDMSCSIPLESKKDRLSRFRARVCINFSGLLAMEGFVFLVGCSVEGNDEVGAVAKFIYDALDVFGGFSVLEIDMK